jgi:chemotaxis protein methyltransferase CheR
MSLQIQGYPYPFSNEDYEFFRSEMKRRCGLSLGAGKAPMMARRLSQRLRSLGVANFVEYRRQLIEAPASPEWQLVINALTTNKTSFFREIHHFKLLDRLLRELLRQRISRIRLWSAACSTGEEPIPWP